MRKNSIILSLVFFLVLVASASYGSIEELKAYFEIRDTIKLMNEEMEKGLLQPNIPSLYDEGDIEIKLESFILFMRARIQEYSMSDSKLKYHYVKQLNSLLNRTSDLYLNAKTIISKKREVAIAEKNKFKGPFEKVEHQYFDSIGLRTLASREPLEADYNNMQPLEKAPVEDSIMLVTSQKEKVEDKKEAEAKTIQPKVAEAKASKAESKPKVKPLLVKEPVPLPATIATVTASLSPKVPVSPIPVAPLIQGAGYMRPMAIMVENHNKARPQSGLYSADILYEMPVEGGITRFMAMFTKAPGLIGPVRSCREYFVDRALEVDALYVHCGGSPMGYAYLAKTKIRSVDEIRNSTPFFRDKLRKAPHNLYGKGKAIYDYMAKRVDMRVATAPVLLSYGERATLGEEAGDYLKIRYHNNYSVDIKYENSVYHRYMNSILHLDRETKQPLEASAVVLQVAAMRTVDKVGRQEISFIGSGKAWIYEKGQRTPVTWHKANPRAKTIYLDNNGQEYLFPKQGQVWVQVVSPNHKLTLKEAKQE